MLRAARAKLVDLGLALAVALLVLASAPSARGAELRVVTFNVAMGLAFRQPMTGLIRDTFSTNEYLRDFDVIGLQEACKNDRAAIELFRDVIKKAHGRVYEHLVLADPKSREHCKKAQVILSRYPIVRSGGLKLPKVGAHRSAAWADLDVGTHILRVYNLHLSNRNGKDFTPVDGRWTQASIVLNHWLDAKRRDPSVRGIVLGDFNSMGDLWRPTRKERTITTYSQHLRPNLERFIPTMFLPYQNDWIFSSGLALRRSYVVPTAYSDHFAVMADYALDGAGRSTDREAKMAERDRRARAGVRLGSINASEPAAEMRTRSGAKVTYGSRTSPRSDAP